MELLFFTIASGVILAYMAWHYGQIKHRQGFEQGRLFERAIQGERSAQLAAQIMRGEVHGDHEVE